MYDNINTIISNMPEFEPKDHYSKKLIISYDGIPVNISELVDNLNKNFHVSQLVDKLNKRFNYAVEFICYLDDEHRQQVAALDYSFNLDKEFYTSSEVLDIMNDITEDFNKVIIRK